MEDFLRNKLNEFEESNDGWDRPDAGVWERAQGQIIAAPKSTLKPKSLVWAGVLALLLLMAGYTWHLQQQLADLQSDLKTQHEKLTQQQLLAKENHNAEMRELTSAHEKLQSANASITKKNEGLEKLVKQQQATISSLKTNYQSLQKTNHKADKTSIAGIQPIETADLAVIESQNPKAVSLENMTLLPAKAIALESSELPTLVVPVKTVLPQKHWPKFEVGYEYALLGLKIPVQADFKDLNAISTPASKTVFTHAHGVYFAYSPKRNWFVRTGLRTAQMTLEQSQESGVYYDKSSEYLKPNGTTANDISLAVRTPYSELESEITLDIPQDANLKTGDWLVFGTYERLRQRYYQVPLGISYFHGNKRLQWQLQGGMQWNKVVFDDYFLKAYVWSKTKVLPVDKVKVLTKDVPSTQYLSAYAGIGLNYQLTQSWHLRSGLAYCFEFNDKSNEFSNSQKIANAFSLGLNYRF